MQSRRKPALLLALATIFICLIQAHAQQEVDPDHFDQPMAAAKHVRGGKLETRHSAKVTQHGNNNKPATAAGHKANHRQNARQTPGNKDILGD